MPMRNDLKSMIKSTKTRIDDMQVRVRNVDRSVLSFIDPTGGGEEHLGQDEATGGPDRPDGPHDQIIKAAMNAHELLREAEDQLSRPKLLDMIFWSRGQEFMVMQNVRTAQLLIVEGIHGAELRALGSYALAAARQLAFTFAYSEPQPKEGPQPKENVNVIDFILAPFEGLFQKNPTDSD